MCQRALAVHQPYAELIMLNKKDKRRDGLMQEFRSGQTHLRERVYVFACQAMDADDRECCEDEGLDASVLPRGVLVGTVEIVGCEWLPARDLFAWLLKNPKRMREPCRPERQPCGGAIFWPFGE